MSTRSVLIVDDDVDWAETVLGYGFEEMGYTVRVVSDLRSARKELDTQAYSIVTVDMCLGKDRQIFEGELVLDYIRDHCRHIPCIIISGSLPAPDMIFEMSRRYPMVPDAGYIPKSKFSYDILVVSFPSGGAMPGMKRAEARDLIQMEGRGRGGGQRARQGDSGVPLSVGRRDPQGL
jgi:CheY-like chemotaxis protein